MAKSAGLNEMRAAIQAELRREVAFQPGPYYEAEGDCIFFFTKDTVTRATRVDDWITVYHDMGSNKVVGAQFKQFHRVLDRIKEIVGSVPNPLKLRFVVHVLTMDGERVSRDKLDAIAVIQEKMDNVMVPEEALAMAGV